MNDEIDTARDDLVFLRAMVTEGGQAQSALGLLLFVAGVAYGAQSFGYWLMEIGAVPPTPMNAFGIFYIALPTLVFLTAVIWVARTTGKQSQHGVASRALNAAFGGAGMASIATAIIFGYIAARRGDMFFWILHPITHFVVQGTVWYVAFAIRKRLWLGAVSLAWFLTAIGLTILLMANQTSWLVLGLAMALFLLMGLPGWILWRTASARI